MGWRSQADFMKKWRETRQNYPQRVKNLGSYTQKTYSQQKPVNSL